MVDCLVIGIDLPKEDANTMLVVRRLRSDQSIEVINTFKGDEAKELYEKLITNKSSLYMKE